MYNAEEKQNCHQCEFSSYIKIIKEDANLSLMCENTCSMHTW